VAVVAVALDHRQDLELVADVDSSFHPFVGHDGRPDPFRSSAVHSGHPSAHLDSSCPVPYPDQVVAVAFSPFAAVGIVVA